MPRQSYLNTSIVTSAALLPESSIPPNDIQYFYPKILFFARYVNYLLGKKIRRKSYPAESYFIQRDPFFDFHTQLPAKPVEIFER